jgi:hypothetical protein
MNMPSEQMPEVNVTIGKLPEADPQVRQAIEDMLEDPSGHFTRIREQRSREAEAYVQEEMRRRLDAQRRSHHTRIGRALLSWFGGGERSESS